MGVLERQAGRRRYLESRRGGQIGFGIGLAAGHVVAGDDPREPPCDPGPLQVVQGTGASGRGGYRPWQPAPVERVQQGHHSVLQRQPAGGDQRVQMLAVQREVAVQREAVAVALADHGAAQVHRAADHAAAEGGRHVDAERHAGAVQRLHRQRFGVQEQAVHVEDHRLDRRVGMIRHRAGLLAGFDAGARPVAKGKEVRTRWCRRPAPAPRRRRAAHRSGRCRSPGRSGTGPSSGRSG